MRRSPSDFLYGYQYWSLAGTIRARAAAAVPASGLPMLDQASNVSSRARTGRWRFAGPWTHNRPVINSPAPVTPVASKKNPQVADHLAQVEKLFQTGELTTVLDPQNEGARWLREQNSKARDQIRGLGH
jgi:hypothetical protein